MCNAVSKKRWMHSKTMVARDLEEGGKKQEKTGRRLLFVDV